MQKEQINSVLESLRKERVRNFNQSVDLIINLKDFDVKKNSINLFIPLPHKIKDKKICAFLENHSDLFDKVILKSEFKKWEKKSEIKKLIKEYDFFVAQASLMPSVATTFGKFLGPVGKMPSPQLGILSQATEKAIKELNEKVNFSLRVKAKEPSLKLSVGKQAMKNEEIIANIIKVYNEIENVLPNKKESIKSIMLKFTMSKPYKLEI